MVPYQFLDDVDLEPFWEWGDEEDDLADDEEVDEDIDEEDDYEYGAQ